MRFLTPLPAKLAFSLVELSIVLVILGLLAGGVLSGQSLIRAAELRSVSTDLQKYAIAFNTFRDKYFTIAGDMTNATQFWGFAGTTAAPNCVSTNRITVITAPGTCDGNGNGVIEGAGAGGKTGEMFQLWKQLQLAGLLEGTYTGLSGSGGSGHSILGINVPRGRINNTGATINYYDAGAGDASNFAINYGNELTFGGLNGVIDTSSPFLKPDEIWNIDTKIDDGKPGTGRMISIYWDTCSTASNAADINAPYDLSVSSISCAIRYKNIFE